MAVTTSTLFETAALAAAETGVYTSSFKTIIDKLTGYASATCTVTIKLVPQGGSASAANVLVVKNFAASESYTFPELVGHTLEAGDFISVLASNTSANLRISGRRVS